MNVWLSKLVGELEAATEYNMFIQFISYKTQSLHDVPLTDITACRAASNDCMIRLTKLLRKSPPESLKQVPEQCQHVLHPA
jgi:hypothetical protein